LQLGRNSGILYSRYKTRVMECNCQAIGNAKYFDSIRVLITQRDLILLAYVRIYGRTFQHVCWASCLINLNLWFAFLNGIKISKYFTELMWLLIIYNLYIYKYKLYIYYITSISSYIIISDIKTVQKFLKRTFTLCIILIKCLVNCTTVQHVKVAYECKWSERFNLVNTHVRSLEVPTGAIMPLK
jgi:hypothetical protein